jgi:hypothetical protein
VDLLPSTRNGRVYNSILVIIDRFTKIAIYIPYNKTCTIEELADIFYEEIIYKYRVPQGIVLDRGSFSPVRTSRASTIPRIRDGSSALPTTLKRMVK